MRRNRCLSHRVSVAVMALMGTFVAGTSLAQQEVEEVVITGSRIKAPNVTSSSPIQVVSEREIRQQGKTDVVDFLNTLPQVFQNSQTDFSNTSNSLSTPGGITTANLRGLGPQRTLVLVDGRRLGTGDANTSNPNPGANLDQIPALLIERVEVVTGGASAVYGSDAVAGVVNFIMKKNFEGFQIDMQYGFNHHENDNGEIQALAAARGLSVPMGTATDGYTRTISMLAGANIAGGEGNVTAYLNYRKSDPITGSDRDFAGCQLFTVLPSAARCGGSSNSNYFSPVGSGAAYTVVGSQFLPWPQTGSDPPAEFNSNAFVNMSRANERYMAGFIAHVELSDYATPYAELNFMNDQTRVVIAPSGLFRGSNPYGQNSQYDINCSNPLLSAPQRAILCTPAQIAADAAAPGSVNANVEIGRRNIEGGGRVADFEHVSYRGVFGLRGDLGKAWKYDAYGQYYYTTLYNANQNYLDFSRITAALQVTGTAQNPVCISGPPCVPYNIFSQGGVTSQQLDYLYTPGTAYGTVRQSTLHADVTADLTEYGLRTPWAQGGVGLNFGVEHRSDELKFDPDAAELSGNLAGFAGASVAIDNGYEVDELFAEVRVPIAERQPGIHELVADAGFRYSDYSTAGGVNTWKLQVQYAPVPALRFRSSLQHAIRAPNIIELFNPQSYGQQSFLGVDPCAPLNGMAATETLERCQRTGVTAAQYGNGLSTNTIPQCVSNQCGQVIGGSPNLKPEEADTLSFGVTWTPDFIRDFSASIDYYRIELNEQIASIPGPYLFTQCLQTGDPRFCSQVVRTPIGALSGSSVASGGYILQTSVNVASAEVSGIDLQASYRLPLSERWGSLNLNLAGSLLTSAEAKPLPGLPSYDCVGLFGPTCQTVNPRWRHSFRLGWNTRWNTEVSLLWRYIGQSSLDNNSDDPSLNFGLFGAFDGYNDELPARSYLDLSAIWAIREGMDLRVGVNNLLDKDPPLVATEKSGTGSANTYPTYDTLGRQIFVGVTARF